MEFSELLKSINSLEDNYPPVHLWNPELCEGVEMRIDREGNWYYQNSIIGRDKLKILFSRILKVEQGQYYLVTPVEKVSVKVDIAPYMIVDYEVDVELKNIILKTNLDYNFPLDASHPIELRVLGKESVPFVQVRDQLEGFISRSVFYGLVELALKQEQVSGSELMLTSGGQKFSLGSIE
jgi:uncharacterized protein